MFNFRQFFIVVLMLIPLSNADAFCGFYVARADQNLYNDASQVVMVRDGDRNVITMNSNFKGSVQQFALVVPVPTVLERSQINVAEKALLDHLDAYSAPRLVEYFDEDPCEVLYRYRMMEDAAVAPTASVQKARAANLGVKIEAEYTVGEYDILILSAEQSDGLITWLTESGYKIPNGASRTVQSYIKQGMKFFVARVNLDEQLKLGYTYLRPLQMAFESPKFMLPIRLGMVNAQRTQDMYVYALTRTGRVETSNYRTVKIPSGMDLPVSIKENFADFYTAMFDRQYELNNRNVAFLEYAWDMSWCDPCAADPLSPQQLRALGVFWTANSESQSSQQRVVRPPQAVDVFITRLHVRYDNEHFPEDLKFIETGDRQNFQGRYVVRHPWKGNAGACPAAERYFNSELPKRQRTEAQQLANLTGWDVDIERNINPDSGKALRWWERLWQ